MAEGMFWGMALALAGAVLAVLARAYLGQRGEGEAPGQKDVAIYKDQLAEVARDQARGLITPDEAARLRQEVARRLLEADRTRQVAPVPQNTAPRGVTLAVAVVLLGVTLAGSVALYLRLGVPGYPDLPLADRIARLDAAIATRPSQTEELVRLGQPRDPALVAATTDALAALTDVAALRQDFTTQLQGGQATAAVLVAERLLEVAGDGITAADHANHALALVAEAQGNISPEAEVSLRAALTLDLTNELARYLVGEMFLQGGRFDQTFRFWRPLAEDGNPDAPWTLSIRDRIGMVAELAGIPYALPEPVGPDAADIAAAAEMEAADRQAMIEGMVAQLSDRLATEGGTIEDWERLIRSLAVLERLAQAQTIYDEAKTRFQGRPAELSFLRMAAVESGLSP